MTEEDAIIFLENHKTRKGNYKKEKVVELIKLLTKNRKCPNCNGNGTVHSACSFGGTGDTSICHVCCGTGKL